MNKFSGAIAYIALSIMAILFVIPYTWLVVESFSPISNLGITIPSHWTLDNFIFVLSSGKFQLAIINGLIISVGATLVSVVIGIGPAYTFSRTSFRFRRALLLAILFLTGFPTFALLVPTYIYFLKIGLYDSLAGVILFLGALNLPITIWILKNTFDQIPHNIEKAAIVDGTTVLQRILYIFVPMAFPAISVVFILNFVLNWGNFYVPYILLSSGGKLPISVAIYSFFGSYDVRYNELAAFSFIYTIPAIVMYIFAQKYMIKAFSIGGTKG